MRSAPTERVGDEVARLSTRGLDVPSFFDETGRILRKAIAFDGFCSMTVDPATMLLTSHIAHDSVRPEDVPRLGQNEFLEEDVNKFAVLARAARPAGVLTDATGHVPERSPRYRDILQPNGFRDELRLTLLDDGACWGWVAFYSREESGNFELEDAALAASLSDHLAQGLRRAILLTAVPTDEEPDALGLILLAPGGSVEAMTPAAERWLSRLIASAPAARRPAGGREQRRVSGRCLRRAAVRPRPRALVCRRPEACGWSFTAQSSAIPRRGERPSSSSPHDRPRSRRSSSPPTA
jgi:hypothetical protein